MAERVHRLDAAALAVEVVYPRVAQGDGRRPPVPGVDAARHVPAPARRRHRPTEGVVDDRGGGAGSVDEGERRMRRIVGRRFGGAVGERPGRASSVPRACAAPRWPRAGGGPVRIRSRDAADYDTLGRLPSPTRPGRRTVAGNPTSFGRVVTGDATSRPGKEMGSPCGSSARKRRAFGSSLSSAPRVAGELSSVSILSTDDGARARRPAGRPGRSIVDAAAGAPRPGSARRRRST